MTSPISSVVLDTIHIVLMCSSLKFFVYALEEPPEIIMVSCILCFSILFLLTWDISGFVLRGSLIDITIGLTSISML